MLKLNTIIFLFLCSSSHFSQNLVHHTTNYFGPNANPIPSFTDAKIPDLTTISVYNDFYFGYGDSTLSSVLETEIPLLKEKISIKFWGVFIESYDVSDLVKQRRGMFKNKGLSSGDLYVQSRIRLSKESQYFPSVILNSTLKTASGSDFHNRRFFNTSGYYFDVELGKSFELQNFFLNKIRFVSDLGFFSWDVLTPNFNVQDDAIMYGLKLLLYHNKISFENTLSGYKGWINRADDYGNNPLIFATKINFNFSKVVCFLQFQKGLRDFPFNQIRIGLKFNVQKLTPNYN